MGIILCWEWCENENKDEWIYLYSSLSNLQIQIIEFIIVIQIIEFILLYTQSIIEFLVKIRAYSNNNHGSFIIVINLDSPFLTLLLFRVLLFLSKSEDIHSWFIIVIQGFLSIRINNSGHQNKIKSITK